MPLRAASRRGEEALGSGEGLLAGRRALRAASRRVPLALGSAAAVALGGCGGAPGDRADFGDSSGDPSSAAFGDPSGNPSSAAFESPRLPDHAPDRFEFGSAASQARVALWDIDVKPDGDGLPPGSGSVEEGRVLYEVQCLVCHGPTGAEGPNDRLVPAGEWRQWPQGRTVGGYWPYATTLFDYVRRAMPQTTPGSLSDDQVYAVSAYVLHLNGLLPADATLDSASLAAVEMPARDRFVPDDRRGGPEVR